MSDISKPVSSLVLNLRHLLPKIRTRTKKRKKERIKKFPINLTKIPQTFKSVSIAAMTLSSLSLHGTHWGHKLPLQIINLIEQILNILYTHWPIIRDIGEVRLQHRGLKDTCPATPCCRTASDTEVPAFGPPGCFPGWYQSSENTPIYGCTLLHFCEIKELGVSVKICWTKVLTVNT